MNRERKERAAMRAAQIADKYIAPDGGPPLRQRAELAIQAQRRDDIITLARFIGWCPEEEGWAGINAMSALKAFSRLTGIPIGELNRIIGKE
jgi:hypothetical protein